MALRAKQEQFCLEYMIDVEKFNRHIDKSGECWEWTGAKTKGYGMFHVGLKRSSSMLAHRVAFGIDNGYLPEAVCHKCDNPSCVNPSHLFGGTRADNNKDMASKGRHWAQTNPEKAKRGSEHPAAKLDETKAKKIIELYKTGSYTQRMLSKDFGVSQRTINKVVNGIGWYHAKVN